MDPQNPFSQVIAAQQPPQLPPPPSPFGTGSLPPVRPSTTTASQTDISPAPLQPNGSAPLGPPVITQPASASPNLSIDYLNQIAPKQSSPTHRFAIFGLIGAVLFAAVAVVIMVSSSGPDISGQAAKLRQRIDTLQAISDDQQKHLNENAIAETNTTLSSVLKSASSELSAIIKARSLKTTTPLTGESGYKTALTSKFDNAYQLGTLDRTYTAQMTYELQLLRSMLVKLKTTAGVKSITTFCDTTVKNIDIILKSYASFAATK